MIFVLRIRGAYFRGGGGAYFRGGGLIIGILRYIRHRFYEVFNPKVRTWRIILRTVIWI